ncbi:50S ribosomal protein L23 [Ignisphaera sp. 4213-co]|uniref:50S ribosomal protein L23 n=1 Tax=Ignisphaera cupida TaxID=3050454 RepID=A0ABD4Z504_9CREN|nr:50S ribosomal protein L23 [Ignisphaera sp. 4213-co]MDK6027975.1 50S ribosomal protein L23 [Ignisphaera sp. 4213-co]
MSQNTEKKNIVVNIVTTEKAYLLAEKYNYITLKVHRNSNKKEIKEFVEKTFNVKVLKVNTLIDRDGYKKAYVKLSPENRALDIIERLSR